MLIPTKHQNLNSNILVIGADILFHIRKEGKILEDLFQAVKSDKKLDLEMFLDALTFLWTIGCVDYENNVISTK